MAQDARERVRALLATACESGVKWNTLDIARRESVVRKIERDCFNQTVISCTRDGITRNFTCPQFVARYSTNCHRVIENLQLPSGYLIDAICSGAISAETVAQLPPSELCPDANRAAREEIELRRQQHVVQKVSRMHTCRKCGADETVSLEYAPRCADEATKHSIKCVKCGNVWRH